MHKGKDLDCNVLPVMMRQYHILTETASLAAKLNKIWECSEDKLYPNMVENE